MNDRTQQPRRRSLAINLCASVAGIVVSVTLGLALPHRPAVWEGAATPLVSHLAHYLFSPLTVAVTAGLFIVKVIRTKVGIFVVFCSFMAGAMLTSSVLMLLRNV